VRSALSLTARRLRNKSTDAEKCLWQRLRSEGLGVKFRRQAVIGSYIVDFVCVGKKLIKECLSSPLPIPPHKGEGILGAVTA
jgi:very-short-patch-repair endonuclease